MGPALEEVLQPALSTSSHSSSPSEVKEDLVKKLRKKKLQEIQSEEHRQTSLSPGKQQQTGTCKENLAACHVTSPLRAQPDREPPRHRASPGQARCRGATAAPRSPIPHLQGWPEEKRRASTGLTACCCFLWQYGFRQDVIHLA